jgi:hypothetical protein
MSVFEDEHSEDLISLSALDSDELLAEAFLLQHCALTYEDKDATSSKTNNPINNLLFIL